MLRIPATILIRIFNSPDTDLCHINQYIKINLLIWLLFLFVVGCSNDASWERVSEKSDIIIDDQIVVNPYAISPLTALVKLELNTEARVNVLVKALNDDVSDLNHSFDVFSKTHDLPILGLFPDHSNVIEFTFIDIEKNVLGKQSYMIRTEKLPDVIPDVVIESIDKEQVTEGYTLISHMRPTTDYMRTINDVGTYLGFEMHKPPYPFIFDQAGNVRWYADFDKNKEVMHTKYFNGIERLQNGNWYFGDNTTNQIFEMDMLGKVVNSWPMEGWEFHHHVLEIPNGNFLVSVSKTGMQTIFDYIIEIDRSSKDVVNIWDLNLSLNNKRYTLKLDSMDWAHVNGLAFDERDSGIVVSCRTQGIIKLTPTNEVKWILGGHKEWGESGRGELLDLYLLTPLDAQDSVIRDPEVLLGNMNHMDFEWPWYPHAPSYMPNGHLLVFDNGDNRNYSTDVKYSRGVEYEIDEENMTIKQVWSYGKERKTETYSRIVSDVDYISSTHHILFNPGAIAAKTNRGKVVEIDYETLNVVFEATIMTYMEEYRPTFHRAERLSLYSD